MNEHAIETLLTESLNLHAAAADEDRLADVPEDIGQLSAIRTFAECGLPMDNAGMVLRFEDGSEFRISVVQSRPGVAAEVADARREAMAACKEQDLADRMIEALGEKIPLQHIVRTTPESLGLLATCLADFADIDPDLEVLNGSGGRMASGGPAAYSAVTDGEYAVLVNAEGYNYPRYRGPRIVLDLLDGLTPQMAKALCVRKDVWPSGHGIHTAEQLAELCANPYREAK